MSFVADIDTIGYQGPEAADPLAFRYYDAGAEVAGKTMAEHLRFAVCYWHSFDALGGDVFGDGAWDRPWANGAADPMAAARAKLAAAFEFIDKLTAPYFCFHDRDVAPEGATFAESEKNLLAIGDDNVIREGVTIHRGLAHDRSRTVIGSGNLFMAYVHIGHDCVIGDRVVMANNASVAGHVAVGDEAVLSGYAGVPQFRSIGASAFGSAMSLVTKDVPAYVAVDGNPAGAVGLNSERLRRLGLAAEAKKALQDAYKVVYRRGLTLKEALRELRTAAEAYPEVAAFVCSIEASEHGIVRERRRQ